MKDGVIVGVDGQPLRRSAAAYEGATGAPRSYGWSAPGIGPNRAILYGGKTLRDRARGGYRNSLLLRSGVNKNVTNEVGSGFTLISTCPDDDFRRDWNALWKVSQNQLDPWGVMNFGALLDLTTRSRRMSGECFVRRVRRRLSSGLEIPLQIEVLEADLCPLDLNRRISARRRIIQGVEFDGKQRVAYWFYKAHPEDGIESVSLNDVERVPARDVVHHYHPLRPGQVRAEPETAAALLKDRTFADYDDSELVRKRERSAFTGFLYREGGGTEDFAYDPATGKSLFDDGEKAGESETVRSGTMLRGVPGEKLELFSGDDTGQGYKDFVRWQALQMAAGQDLPYQLLTGDWEGVNDRLVRAILNEYRRTIRFAQMNLSGFQVAFKIWQWAIDEAVLVGRISAPQFSKNPYRFYSVDIRPDAFKHLHPEQDINARNKAIGNNISNVEAEAAEYGRDLDDNMRRNAKAAKRWIEICKQEGIDEPASMSGLFSAFDLTSEGGGGDE
jgi:lambda family phage portal protein